MSIQTLPNPRQAKTRWLPISELRTDPKVNRPLEQRRVERIRDSFDASLLGVIIVAEDNGYIILDGQHRVAALTELWDSTRKIEAKVYSGLTIPQMAEMFVGLNDAKKPHPIQIFMKRETAGDPVAVTIGKMVRDHGLEINLRSQDGHITAVNALDKVYHGFGKNGASPELLDNVLSVALGAWGRTSNAVRSETLVGLGLVLSRDGNLIDKSALIQKLSVRHAGAAGVIADAKQLRNARGGSLANNVADVIVATYNKGRVKNRLPNWNS